MSTALTCQDAGFVGGHQQPHDSTLYPAPPTARTVDVSMDTLASFWVRAAASTPDNRPYCQDALPPLRERLSSFNYGRSPDPVWNDQLSPHLQRNRQLQDTLLQREEELARLQEENNKLKEFLNSSFVKNLEEKVKRLNAEGKRKLKRSLHADVINRKERLGTFQNLSSSQPVLPSSQRQANKRVCRNLNFEFCSEGELAAAASEPSSLDHWVLKTLGLKDRDTIDTSSSSSAAEYSPSSSSSDNSHRSSFNQTVTSPRHTAISSSSSSAEYHLNAASYDHTVTSPNRTTPSSSSSTADYSLSTRSYYPTTTTTTTTPIRTPLCSSSPNEHHLNSASYKRTITSLNHTALSSSSSSSSSSSTGYSLNTASYDRTVDTALSPTAIHNSDNYCQTASHQATYSYSAVVDNAACRDVDIELPSSCGTSAFDNSVHNYSHSAGRCSNSTGSGSVVPYGPNDTVINSYHPATANQSPLTRTPSAESKIVSTVQSKETVQFIQSMESTQFTQSPEIIQYTRAPDTAQFTPILASSPVKSNHGGSTMHFAPSHHCHSPTSSPPGRSAVGALPPTPSPSTPRGRTGVAFSMSLSPSSSVRTHSFPQGQAFVRKDAEGRWNFTWVPKQGP